MAPKALAVKDLHKVYGNGQTALENVSLAVEPGDFFALLGPNGAGKSTLLGIVCSLVNPSGGEVCVFGHDVVKAPGVAKACLGVVPQEINFNLWETPLEIVISQAGYYGIPRKVAKQRAPVYLEQLGLWERRNDMARNLSGGMKRRLMVARALVHEPKLLLLDEPTAGVDIELRHSTWEYLRRINAGGTTIILTTHYLEEAEQLCKHIAIIDRGRIVKNTSMEQLLNTLHRETFLLDLRIPVARPPTVENYPLRQVDATTLEVDIARGQGMSQLFAALACQGHEVLSLRNKSTRLEALFLHLTGQPQDQPQGQPQNDTAAEQKP